MSSCEHTGLTVRETTDGFRAVFTTLHETLGDEQFDHVMAQLPANPGTWQSRAHGTGNRARGN